MQRYSDALIRLMALVLLASLLGCTAPSPPSRFYRLDSQPIGIVMPQQVQAGESIPLVGVGPVRLASYLDRPQIVERQSPHRLTLHEFDRWGGTLQENMVQVLTNIMQKELSQSQVIGFPWQGGVEPDYEVLLYISRFERQEDRIQLQARWSLMQREGRRLIHLDQSAIETQVDGFGIESSVAASGQAVQILAREIAAQLQPLLSDQR
jgi:uncharacterized lipoprotein YmbA